MTLRFSREIKADLLRIGDHIARDSPVRALDFVRDLRAQSRELADMPLAFPLVSGFERFGIRRRIVGNYLIFYRAEETVVSIIHIMHGARDYESWLSRS